MVINALPCPNQRLGKHTGYEIFTGLVLGVIVGMCLLLLTTPVWYSGAFVLVVLALMFCYEEANSWPRSLSMLATVAVILLGYGVYTFF